MYIYINRAIGIMVRVFANGLGDQGSIPGRVTLKKMVLNAALLNTCHYKVWIKGKVEQFRKWSSASPNNSVFELLKRSLWVALNYGCQLYLYIYIYIYEYIWTYIYIYIYIVVFGIKDSFSFTKIIRNFSPTDMFMCSFDICSLYTNVPLE